jgi:transglutaminase superfamily protein
MFWLVCQSYCALLRFDMYLIRNDFGALHRSVRNAVTAPFRGLAANSICRAVDLASVFYFKEVLCLQRSAAATVLLRKYGIRAELVVGVQHWPFRAHAWVEVDGQVVNDKPYTSEMYAVLDRS